MKTADQVWVALALLHRQKPYVEGFGKAEIEERVRMEFGQLSAGVVPHLYLHCVANRRPNPGRYRMLYLLGARSAEKVGSPRLPETAAVYGKPAARWRLFRLGDDYAPEREGGKMYPAKADLPAKYHDLVRWYLEEYASGLRVFGPESPWLAMVGIWEGGPTDASERHHEYLAAGREKGM